MCQLYGRVLRVLEVFKLVCRVIRGFVGVGRFVSVGLLGRWMWVFIPRRFSDRHCMEVDTNRKHM